MSKSKEVMEVADQEKIRIMSRLAILENQNGRELERYQKSFRSDYIGIPMLKNALRITAVFLLLLVVWGSGRVEWLLDVTADGQMGLLLIGILTAYLTILLVTLIVTFLVVSAGYYRIRETAEEYQELLEELMRQEQHPAAGAYRIQEDGGKR